jgi:hypothetical protein
MERLKNKIRHIRNFLLGWAKNMRRVYKKEKERLLLLIDELYLKAEIFPSSVAEWAPKKEADECFAKLRRDE